MIKIKTKNHGHQQPTRAICDTIAHAKKMGRSIEGSRVGPKSWQIVRDLMRAGF